MSKKLSMANSSEQIMIGFATGILLILFVPIPSGLLDLLLITNFSWALTILLLAFYTDTPLSFSTFPSLLLISTLFRLALNVSATRLILSDGDAGHVIGAIGQYVIQGNYVMGMVVFIILIIVQYVVVTNGAQRVAEVAARFTLDSMPGKQMSIDADLNMGLISQADAKKRRTQIEKEASFYGAMDGASKFVKGDAIAGIMIMLVDLIGGFAIGMAQKGLSLSESIQTYSLLTVGDGLVTQIPALTISMATGIIVTRAASDAHLGSEVARQISSYPKSLIMVSLSLVGLLCLKGIPTLPVLVVLSFFAIAAAVAMRAKKDNSEHLSKEISLYEKIQIHPIEIHLNSELYKELTTHESEFLSMTSQIREQIAFELGFVIPEVILVADPKLPYPQYTLNIQGQQQGIHPLHMDKVLAILPNSKNVNSLQGIEVKDPSYGLPAVWISEEVDKTPQANIITFSNPLNVLATHLQDVLLNHLPNLLTRTETEALLEQSNVSSLRDELIPSLLPLGHVQKILQNLLQEKVSIRHLSNILEVLLDNAKNITDPNQLTELVRSRLATPICQTLLNASNQLPVLTLASPLEQQLSQSLVNQTLALEPSLTEHFLMSLAGQVEKMISDRKKPVLLCSTLLRRQIKQLTQRVIPNLTVLGMNEIPLTIQVESFGVIK